MSGYDVIAGVILILVVIAIREYSDEHVHTELSPFAHTLKSDEGPGPKTGSPDQ